MIRNGFAIFALSAAFIAAPVLGANELGKEQVGEDTVADKLQETDNESFVLASAPEADAVTVTQLRESGYVPGQRVTVRGQIGGRKMPWIKGMALMVVADANSLATCTTGSCGTPWGFCSAPADKLHQYTGIVRWLDEEGKPRRVSFHELADIAPLSTVVITGTIADVGDPRALVIDADGLFLEDRGPYGDMMDQLKKSGKGPYATSPNPGS